MKRKNGGKRMENSTSALQTSPSLTSRDRFVREREAREMSQLSRTSRWRKEREGTFPRRYRISAGLTAYKLSELVEWLDAQGK